MITIDSITFAEHIIIDRQTNKVSLINVIDDIIPIGFPLILPNLAVAVLFTREVSNPESKTYSLQVEFNSKITVANTPLDVNFFGKLKTRSIINIQSLVIDSPGDLIFKVTGESDQLEKKLNIYSTPKVTSS